MSTTTLHPHAEPRTDPIASTATLPVVVAGTTLALVVFTMMVTTVTATAASFASGAAGQTWALSAMSLGLAGALLAAGGIADNLGHRRVFAVGSAGLAATLVLAAAAPSMAVFVVARVLSGVAAAGVLAGGLGLIAVVHPSGPARTRATGLWGAALGAGIAAGPVYGAGVAELDGWRAASGVAAVAAVGLWALSALLPGAPAQRTRRRLDRAGAGTMFVAMAALVGAITAGRSDWTSTLTLALLALAAVALVAFVAVERRGAVPLLDLGLFGRIEFVVSVVGSGVTGLATIAIMSYTPSMLERGLGQTALHAGLILAIWSSTSTLVATQMSRLPERISPHARLATGLVLSAVGIGGLAVLGSGSSWTAMIPGLLVAGVGSGATNAALARVAVESVPAGRAALGSGASNTARYLGSALGITVVVAVATSGGAGHDAALVGYRHAAELAAALNLVGLLPLLAARQATAR